MQLENLQMDGQKTFLEQKCGDSWSEIPEIRNIKQKAPDLWSLPAAIAFFPHCGTQRK